MFVILAATVRRSQGPSSEHDARLNTMPWGAGLRLRHPHLHYLVDVGNMWAFATETLDCNFIDFRSGVHMIIACVPAIYALY